MRLLDQVDEVIRTHRLIPRQGRVVVGVSGGLDSMVLLHLLHALAGDYRWTLTVAHLNHQLRGHTGAADARWVRRAADRLLLRCVAECGDVKGLAARERLSIEMAGRRLRHEFLARTARSMAANAVALAHHAQDQVELFFLRLLRGAGSGGLAGMPWTNPSPADAGVRLIRPLLGVTRAELEEHARAHRIRHREDASNRNLDILRNRIRHRLLPLLEEEFQPALIPVVLRQMEILSGEHEFLNEALGAWVSRAKAPPFAQWPVALQRRRLQAALRRLGVEGDFAMIEALREEPPRRVMIAPGRTVRRDAAGRLHLAAWPPDDFAPAEVSTRLHGRSGSIFFAGRNLIWKHRPMKRGEVPPRRAGCEWFDADRVGRSIVLRHWRRGDRFQPIGMERPVKLQDLFTNLKVPVSERRQRLLACTAPGEIWWVQGLRISEGFKVGPRTRRRLEWRWEPA